MVLFDNINVNQEVEVKWHGDIRKGKVRYKGPINGYKGDWVGVELYANGKTTRDGTRVLFHLFIMY